MKDKITHRQFLLMFVRFANLAIWEGVKIKPETIDKFLEWYNNEKKKV